MTAAPDDATGVPVDAALFAHVVLTAPTDDTGRRAFAEAWSELCVNLGLGERHGDVPLMPTGWGDAYREEVLAASQRPESLPTSFDSAVLRRLHEDVVISIALVPGTGVTADQWQRLDERWSRAAAQFRPWILPAGENDNGVARLVGACRLLTAELDRPELTDDVLGLVPDGRAHPSRGFQLETDPHLRLWPLPSSTGDGAEAAERFVVLSRRGLSEAVTPLVWMDHGGLPLFAHQHRLAARIEIVRRDWLSGREEISRLAHDMDVGLGMLRSSLGTLATERSQLDEISASTAAVQSQLVDLRPLVRRFRQNRLALSAAVDALRPSLSIYRAADAAGGPAAPLDDALHRGEWLVDQLGVDIEVSENHHASGREMLEDVRGAVARGRSELVRQANEFQEDFAKRAERFTVLQTAVIGAVVMFLTAMQSLDYKITFIPPSGQAALLLLLPALALWPGLVAVRLVRQPKGLARRPDSWRARWPELGAAGLVGAAAGWTLDSAVLSRFSWWLQVGEPGQLRLTLVTAGVGLLALPATLVGWTVFRHRRRG